jgi:hypothetical protein
MQQPLNFCVQQLLHFCVQALYLENEKKFCAVQWEACAVSEQ